MASRSLGGHISALSWNLLTAKECAVKMRRSGFFATSQTTRIAWVVLPFILILALLLSDRILVVETGVERSAAYEQQTSETFE
jgi:hypothetical protein